MCHTHVLYTHRRSLFYYFVFLYDVLLLQAGVDRELDDVESRIDILRQMAVQSDYLDDSIISEVSVISLYSSLVISTIVNRKLYFGP